MSGVLFSNPLARQLSISGAILPGWSATFFRTNTTTPANVYSDGTLSTSLGGIVTAEADGHMVPIYLDPDVVYRVQIKDANGALVPDGDIDPIDVSRGSSGGGASEDATFITVDDETASLSSSRRLLADSTIEMDDSVAGQRTVKTRAILPVNAQIGTTYTLVLSDLGKVVEMNNASPNVLTIPPDTFDVYSTVMVRQMGAGQTSIVAGIGVTIRTPATLDLLTRYSIISLHQRATNEWCVEGGLAQS